jgi:hypothetical protein
MFKVGDSVIVNPIDGPKPAGIPYAGYKTTVIQAGETSCIVKGTNGIEHSFCFVEELTLNN